MDARFGRLLERWQDGEASGEERRELERSLRADPGLRRLLVNRVLQDVYLYRRYAAEGVARAAFAPRHRAWERVAVAALAVAASLAIAFLLLRGEATPKVLSGDARVEDSRIDVDGPLPAVLRLAGGTRATLQPSSVAVAREGTFKLERGGGRFRVERGAVPFRIITSVGTIGASESEFSAELRPGAKKGERNMSSLVALVVSVLSGSVEVKVDGKTLALAAGESREFALVPALGQDKEKEKEKDDDGKEKKEGKGKKEGEGKGKKEKEREDEGKEKKEGGKKEGGKEREKEDEGKGKKEGEKEEKGKKKEKDD